MSHFNPRALLPVSVIAAFGIGGWYIEAQRSRERSALSGYFESRPIQVASRVGGRIEAIRVREGDNVKPGALLLVLEAKPSAAETAAKAALAAQARANAAEARNGPRPQEIQRQEAVVAEAQANLDRLRNGARPEEIGAARARLEQARAQYQKVLAGARPEEVAEARAGERAAKARLAQVERGLTPEERAQARARFDAAAAADRLASKEEMRTEYLVREGAYSRQQLDRARADLETAQAHTAEMREALRRAEMGSPKEEIDQAREVYRQTRAALDLVQAGSRKEDVEAARAEMSAAQQSLELVRKGSRPEDIRAGEAKLREALAQLDELKEGSRKERIRAALASASAAEAQQRGSEETLSERQVRAPQAGLIERIVVAIGDLVQPTTPLLRIASQDDIWLRVYVPESSLAHVKAGAGATLRIDGISGDVPALVESVATAGEFTPANLQTPEERGKQVFAVRLRLEKPDPKVKAGIFATVKRLGDQTW